MGQNSKKTVKKGFANENQKKNINRKGRPKKGMSMSDILKEYLDETIDDKTRKELLIEKIYNLALKNDDLGALKYLFDRESGKPKEHKEIEIDTREPVSIEFIPVKNKNNKNEV